MRDKLPEDCRISLAHHFARNAALDKRMITMTGDRHGTFIVPRPGKNSGSFFVVIVSDAGGWDHVSVHIPSEKRTPTWEEMCFIKDLFFTPEEAAFQFHPRIQDYINFHNYTLHLWRPQALDAPIPDANIVAFMHG